MRLALLQHKPSPGSLESSLQRLSNYAAKASAAGCNLLLLPEASMTGYNLSIPDRDKFAQPLNGSLSDAVAVICRRENLAIAYGFIEKAGAEYFNTVQVINCEGEPAGYYRKAHLWGDQDRALFSPGESFSPLIDIDGWKIGLLICYDVEFPESVRHHALAGADLILVSTALMAPWVEVADLIVPARAYESQVYIAYANYIGEENGTRYVGHSNIVGPDGRQLEQAGKAEILLLATLEKSELSKVRQAVPYRQDRRPELYSD